MSTILLCSHAIENILVWDPHPDVISLPTHFLFLLCFSLSVSGCPCVPFHLDKKPWRSLTKQVWCESVIYFEVKLCYSLIRFRFAFHYIYYWKVVSRIFWLLLLFIQELEKILSDTPPVWKGTSKLFRNLRERGEFCCPYS